jgi:hypothetical protein
MQPILLTTTAKTVTMEETLATTPIPVIDDGLSPPTFAQVA